ncbi:MAG: hypothetical protein AAB393_09010, partial [Bacteroidota bacterium]
APGKEIADLLTQREMSLEPPACGCNKRNHWLPFEGAAPGRNHRAVPQAARPGEESIAAERQKDRVSCTAR